MIVIEVVYKGMWLYGLYRARHVVEFAGTKLHNAGMFLSNIYTYVVVELSSFQICLWTMPLDASRLEEGSYRLEEVKSDVTCFPQKIDNFL